MVNHRMDEARGGGAARGRERGARFGERNPNLYGNARQNRQVAVQNQLTNLRELRRNMENFDSMLDEIDRFQQQTEGLVANL